MVVGMILAFAAEDGGQQNFITRIEIEQYKAIVVSQQNISRSVNVKLFHNLLYLLV